MEYIKDSVLDANCLYHGYKRAKKSSAWKSDVQAFEMDFLLRIAKIQKKSKNGTYRTAKGSSFIVHERGKVRLIKGLQMDDRVFRHTYCDYCLTPLLKPLLIYDNYASLENRGISMARKRFELFLHKWYRKHGNRGYILIMDYSGYYDNILHDEVRRMLYPLMDSDLDRKCLDIILKDSEVDVSYLSEEEQHLMRETKFKMLDHYERDTGEGKCIWKKSLNIGDQGSQNIGVYYPTEIDNYVKIVRGVKFYGRYMDDSYIIAETIEELMSIFEGICRIAKRLGIFINLKKTKIFKLSDKYRFLQMQYSLTDTGRLIIKINPERVTAMRTRMKKLSKKEDNKEVSDGTLWNVFNSWIMNYGKYMSRKQRDNLYILYRKLKFKESEDIWKGLA